VQILADVDVKHSAPVAVRPLEEEVEELIDRGCADAVIVTGAATGKQTSLEDLKRAKQAAGRAPVIAGSGVTASNVSTVMNVADGAIVGTFFKRDGMTTNPVDPGRVQALISALRL
jgi:membrane complex biogenesis BtpA family protein